METLGISLDISCQTQIVTVLPLPFQFPWFLLFFLLDCSLGLPILYYIELVRMYILVLTLILQERLLSPFIFEYDIRCRFVMNNLYYVDRSSPYTYFNENFYHEWIFNFFKCFSGIYWDEHVTFILPLLMCYFTLIDGNFEISLYPWNKSHLIMVYYPFSTLLKMIC